MGLCSTIVNRGCEGDMKLEDQVVSLELAKKLKELGVKQESLFCWGERSSYTYPGRELEAKLVWELYQVSTYKPRLGLDVSAFTVAELGEMLPQWYPNGDVVDQIPHMTIGRYWRVNLDDEGTLCSETKEADARAKMLIYLIENHLITA